jgi:tetratricopeptide (TPR) repeat protein
VRRDEMPAALTQWLQTDDTNGVELLNLEGLDAAGVTELLASLGLPRVEPAAWSERLLHHAGGNPLYTLETLRALLNHGGAVPSPDAPLPVPKGLGALIGRRLDRLSEAALRLARLAALAGADFDADVAARVLETHPLDLVEPWRELERAQLLQDGRLSHDLIAEATLHSLPAGIAQSLQARLAGSLEALGHGPARVAPHWAQAQAWSRAADAYAQAARDAQRASRRADEVLWWEQAADCYERAGQAGKAFEARADSLESLLFVRGTTAGRALADRLAADERTEPQRLRASLAQAHVALMGGDHASGERAARAALELATRLGTLWPRFEAARLLAIALAQAQRAAEALQAIEPFRDVVVAEGSVEQCQHFWSDYAYALKAAQRQGATAEALREAMRCAQQTGDFAELATLTSNLAVVEGNFGHAEQALAHARRARALRDPLGGAGGPASGAIDLYVGVYAGAVGRYAEALDDLQRAATVFAGNGDPVWQALAANHRAHLLLQLGQHARARQALQYESPPMAGMLARRALLESRLERALGGRGDDALRRALDLLGERGDPMLAMLVHLEATLSEAPEHAARRCAAVRAEAEAQEHVGIALRARLLQVHHLTRGARLGDAPGALESLTTELATIQPMDTFMPQAWWILVQAYVALGCDDAADAALAQGYDWAVRRALPHVPAPFRDSYLNRNAANRVLIAAAGRRLGEYVPPAASSAAGTTE